MKNNDKPAKTVKGGTLIGIALQRSVSAESDNEKASLRSKTSKVGKTRYDK